MSFEVFTPLFLLVCLAFDAFCFIKFKHLKPALAIGFFGFWTLLALLFCGFIYLEFSHEKAVEFLTGYILERTLSLDNIFVFCVIFGFFKVPHEAGERALFWGILLAIVLRIIFIIAGAELVERFGFIMYFFGAFLVFTGIKLIMAEDEHKEENFETNLVVRVVKKFVDVSPNFSGTRMFVREGGKRIATPLFLVFALIAFTDVIFALDSIPAIFAITLDPLIVITANFFSLMGLRAVFFLIEHIVKLFYYLKYALSAILVFVGVKMLIVQFYHIPISASLGVIFSLIILAIVASILRAKFFSGA